MAWTVTFPLTRNYIAEVLSQGHWPKYPKFQPSPSLVEAFAPQPFKLTHQDLHPSVGKSTREFGITGRRTRLPGSPT